MKRMKFSLTTVFLTVCNMTASAQSYGYGNWDADTFGNHRVVLSVDKSADAVIADIEWRRRDNNPKDENIIVVDAATGQQLDNVRPISITAEKGCIAFQPETVPGIYYVYYLQNVMSGSPYYPTVTYPSFTDKSSPDWVKRNNLNGKRIPRLPKAKVEQFQAIDELNSFYPMEVIATTAEKEGIIKEQTGSGYILFTEDRKYPVRMTDNIPYRWIKEGHHDSFSGFADRGEYYVFQTAVWAARGDVSGIGVEFSDFVDRKSGTCIPSSRCTCFNTEGVDVNGNVFNKECSVKLGRVQSLWIGMDIPENTIPGIYEGTVTVTSQEAGEQRVAVSISVSDNVIPNHGDDEPWRHSRLRWLNSQKGCDDIVISPYIPVSTEGMTIKCLGREVTLDRTGFPRQIKSFFKPSMTEIGMEGRDILASPITLNCDGGCWENLDFSFTEEHLSSVKWKALNRNDLLLMDLEGELEADGNIGYRIRLIALKDSDVGDIALSTLFSDGIGEYMLGLGRRGGYCPENYEWKWDVEKNQDAVWIGDVNAGLQLRFFDDRYERPLNTNFYHQKPLVMPASWCNGGKGGIDIRKDDNGTTSVISYSGHRTVKKGDALCYFFNIAITPFRPIDTNKQWRERYWHRFDPVEVVEKGGGNVINIHHATDINPYINYPFLRAADMKAYIDEAHSRGMRVKIYNTVRELSNSCIELPALRSLGNEIFSEGEGGGFSWLQEHLDQNYIAAWFARRVKDAAIVNTGVSRWHNYYIEGLDWLVRNVGIDGLYIDDLAFDRNLMKRVRKVLNSYNPGAMIDLHSANQYNPRDGFANSANLYMEHLPYIDRLWFGEYFDYGSEPEFWLTELSGIPFGLMGEMLQDNGNPWRGMLYGMTARKPIVDNSPLWQAWDSFGMDGSEMIGYWVKDNPVKTGDEFVPATVYCHPGKRAMISLASWRTGSTPVRLDIDWNALGLDVSSASMCAPHIEGFQDGHIWKPGETVTVPEGKGLLIIIK